MPVKFYTYDATKIFGPGDHELFSFILGPDRDHPEKQTLHLRCPYSVFATIAGLTVEEREDMLADMERLFDTYKQKVRGV